MLFSRQALDAAIKAFRVHLGCCLLAAAKRAHMRLQCGRLLRAGGCVAGGEEPVQFMLGKRGRKPAQQQMSGFG